MSRGREGGFGRGVSGCKAAKCGDGFVQAGTEGRDDGNAVINDGCGSQCRSAVCLSFTDTAAEDVTDNNWFDACAAAPGNTVNVKLFDVNNDVVYQASGPKVGVWSQNQVTSTIEPQQHYTRQFTGWTQGREIAWNNGNTMNTCSSTVGFLGKFTVSITP